jgi:hypothetical protein
MTQIETLQQESRFTLPKSVISLPPPGSSLLLSKNGGSDNNHVSSTSPALPDSAHGRRRSAVFTDDATLKQ